MVFRFFLLTLIYTILCHTESCLGMSDPCHTNNHKTFPDYDFGSRNEKCDPKQSALCDFYFVSDWYIVQNATVLNHCPSGYCGTTYPGWMQGTFPEVGDGIVNRTACIKFHTNCCQENVTIMVKNCTSFYVFYFVQLRTCPMAYCFESNLPCIPPTTTSSPGVSGSSVTKYKETTTDGIQRTTLSTIIPGDGNGLSKTGHDSKAIIIGVSVGILGVSFGVAVLGYFLLKKRLPKRDSTMQFTNHTYENSKLAKK